MFGPLEVTLAHRTVGARRFGGIKPRQLLEVLLLERGRPVSKDHIADCLWGQRLPVSAAATIETYVSQLRRIVGRQVSHTEAGGYRVPAAAVDTDLDSFDALVRRAAAASGEHRRAPGSRALGWWSCRERTTTRGSATSGRCSPRSRSSSPWWVSRPWWPGRRSGSG